jgi:hypothetical protein
MQTSLIRAAGPQVRDPAHQVNQHEADPLFLLGQTREHAFGRATVLQRALVRPSLDRKER